MSFRKEYTSHLKVCFFLFCLIAIFQPQFAQDIPTHRNCGHDAYLEHHMHQQPELIEAIAAFEQETQKRMAHPLHSKSQDEVIVIPTVIHIVWSSNEPQSNITDEQIQSQLDVLNADFRRKNADTVNTRDIFKSIAADIQVEFRLATVDPDGQPTTGIERRETSRTSFSTGNDEMKFEAQGGLDAWDPGHYLNMWVVSSLGSGILGFAQPPALLPFARSTDGVVIADQYFGTMGTARFPFNGGRTTTHEVGHWLNLNHPWGPGNNSTNCNTDDGVSDTPPTPEPNYACSFNANSCATDSPDLPDMVENFMDYTNDACMNIYTEGQKARVYSILNPGGRRHSLLSSPGFVEPVANDIALLGLQYSASIPEPTEETLCTAFTPTIELQNLGSEIIYFVLIDYILDGIQVKNVLVDFSLNPLTFQSQGTFELPLIHTLSDGEEHTLVVDIVSLNGLPDEKIEDNQLTLSFNTIPTGAVELKEVFATEFPPENWTAVNEDDAITFETIVLNEAEVADTVLYINNFDYVDAIGTFDEFVLPDLDLKADNEQIYLNFLRAYAQQNEEEIPDMLSILISTDCGKTYHTIYEKSGVDLATTSPKTTAFTPIATDWVAESIDLSDFAGARNASIRFVHNRGEGNNLYLSAIYTDSREADIVGITPTLSPDISFNLYPNPTAQQTTLQLNVEKTMMTQVVVTDYAGKMIYQQDWHIQAGKNQLPLQLADVASGLYLVHVYMQEGVISEKLLLIGQH